MENIADMILAAELNNNTNAWAYGAQVFIDSEKPMQRFIADAAELGYRIELVYLATRQEEINAMSGDGECHGKEFGGKKCIMHVYVASPIYK